MKTTKKTWVVSFMALALLSLLLSACGGSAANTAGNNNAENSAGEAADASNLLGKIQAAGVIKVGIMGTYPPYNSLGKNGEYEGFDVDIAKGIADKLGVTAEFSAQDFSSLIPSLQADKLDAIVSQVTITDERKQVIDFSDPYITNSVKIIVGENNTDITTIQDFAGKTIGVGLGTNDESYLRNDVLPEVGNFEIKTYNDVITSLQDLNAGRIDATINNMYALKPIVDENGFKIKAVGEPIKSDQAGVAIRQDNPELKEAMNKALADMKADGSYDEIFKKWFGEAPPAE
ncbi:transporter substrate-binding domain-containing protein [Paenibacillus sp. P96]|uniref:Transporter substrate-binding domain-containing protein n=1 Tax=Paenibacillus zeirhizosphaerae TaxID=2987519 RepID=A0ABT9FXI8_9BACL|nr:transporter substrate-binding domain-containing protein [Paenibacillus sp. P96]MDP4099443.1 transporter substrate-binding domain-containing protein [Paenibacillus sp. P96]